MNEQDTATLRRLIGDMEKQNATRTPIFEQCPDVYKLTSNCCLQDGHDGDHVTEGGAKWLT